jgi:hypothetical protein
MRTSIVAVLLGLLAAGGLEAPPASAAERTVFRYGSGDAGGALIHDYANRWVEFVGSDERYAFEEVGRSDDTIELRDRGRDVGLKVHAEQGELRLPGSTTWQPWERGKWISFDELPRSIRFIPTDQKIRLAYFVAKDRQPIANYERRIRVVMQVVADIYRSDLQAKGYHSDGLTLETDRRGQPVVHLIQGAKPAQYYNDAPAFDESKQYVRVMGEIPADVGSVRRHMLVVFPETYEPGPAPVEWRGSVGRGAHFSTDGGLAMMSAWILRDEFCAKTFDEQKKLILDATPILGRTALGTGRVNSPRFEFIEDGFGATAHELGHALGLPHDTRAPNDLMGYGFRNLQANYRSTSARARPVKFSRENARLLGVSRYLVPATDRTDNSPPTAEIKLRLVNGPPPTVVVTMKATDDCGLRAVVFTDPDTVIGGAELKGRNQTVEVTLPLKVLKAGDFKLITMLADAGGNITTIVSSAPTP